MAAYMQYTDNNKTLYKTDKTSTNPPHADNSHITVATNSQTPTSRFLALPGELRNKIFSLAIEDDVLSLGAFATPSLSRASRQLRQECLPVFFSEAQFQLDIAARISSSGTISLVRLFDGQEFADPEELDTPRELACDSLCLEPSVKEFAKNSESSIFFQNVTFSVVELLRDTMDERLEKCELSEPACSMTLKVDGRLGVRVEISEDMFAGWSWDTRSAVTGMEVAKGKAEDLAAREDCRGFTMSDLEEIAKYFTAATANGARP